MIKLNKKYYKETGEKIYKVRYSKNLEIIAESSRETCDNYSISDAFVCKQDGELFVFGCGRNTAWVGYRIDSYTGENPIALFEKYDY